MKRNKLKTILGRYYKESAVNHILRGIRRPSYEKIIEMHDNHGIPFDAWQDIRTYLQDNDAEKEHRKVG